MTEDKERLTVEELRSSMVHYTPHEIDYGAGMSDRDWDKLVWTFAYTSLAICIGVSLCVISIVLGL